MFFFFTDTATTEIYTLSLHDALPICCAMPQMPCTRASWFDVSRAAATSGCTSPRRTSSNCAFCRIRMSARSEEHTSELQSLAYLVCRLLLEKKKIKHRNCQHIISSQY